jgi:thioredoxin reductase (NADPH)
MILDCIVIGGGISGLTASIYLRNSHKSVAVIDESYGGNIVKAVKIVNYPGFDEITGEELYDKIYYQADKLGVNIVHDKVIDIVEEDSVFKLSTAEGTILNSKFIILATGTKHRTLSAKIENSNIHYCAVCDGSFYEGKKVAVIGGGDSALSTAVYLSGLNCDVRIFYRGQFLRASEYWKFQIHKLDIPVYCNRDLVSIINNHPTFKKDEFNTTESYDIDAYFVCIGQDPNVELCEKLKVELGDGSSARLGYPIVGIHNLDYEHSTSNPKVFACGSVIGYKYDQAIRAASDAAACALELVEYSRFWN